jgi:hypothetical protein
MDGPSLALPYLALLLVGFTEHPMSPSDLVSSYLTPSPLPADAEAMAGGLLSVALSLGSPPLDVIQHHALWSPDFPLPAFAKASAGSGHLDCFDQSLYYSETSPASLRI